MDEKNNTTITITPPKDSGLELCTIVIAQEYIETERLDILKKACERAWQEFVKANEWETAGL